MFIKNISQLSFLLLFIMNLTHGIQNGDFPQLGSFPQLSPLGAKSLLLHECETNSRFTQQCTDLNTILETIASEGASEKTFYIGWYGTTQTSTNAPKKLRDKIRAIKNIPAQKLDEMEKMVEVTIREILANENENVVNKEILKLITLGDALAAQRTSDLLTQEYNDLIAQSKKENKEMIERFEAARNYQHKP